MALFSAPQEARPVWTLRQAPAPRGSQDDEDERQCEGCRKWLHARDASPRYVLEVHTADEGTPREKYLCAECAQRHVIEKWLYAVLPQTRPVAMATFSGATAWEGTNADGGFVQFVVVQWAKASPADADEDEA